MMKDKPDIGERLRARAPGQHPELAGVYGSYRWDVEDVGSYYMAVADGSVTVREGRLDADCTIGSNEDDFWAIVEGRQNLLTAFMQGRVHMEGDIALAQKLHGLMPGPMNVGAPVLSSTEGQ